MTYTGAMALPSNAVCLNNDEMRYVEGGGWSTYKGAAALSYLSTIAAQAFGGYVASAKLGKYVCAVSATGWGLIAGLAGALGVAVCIGYGTYQAAMFAQGLVYYRKYKKFKANSVSIWKFSATIGIKKA